MIDLKMFDHFRADNRHIDTQTRERRDLFRALQTNANTNRHIRFYRTNPPDNPFQCSAQFSAHIR